ncbi:hypothetical protein TVNIR_1872 [Thioalkalivibrio nitratireducens DSM 14787]|uniref:Periplasmic heavy metal sensor n=1 Tax=Thioalkalivibrio nitratireducens (strain DSM 14787 / UNIQEM 213 / ALEN2) TaxID=1255043 RepID=L0DWW0_THIND|nr:Spy/CpxP family protein refolding chaperone [Thioalkalivibrio nitratireducens]AGA33533.1 hypothetical protein TVNIR_1872 [Thioalkalivibrio nitratireducens DSM 14787]
MKKALLLPILCIALPALAQPPHAHPHPGHGESHIHPDPGHTAETASGPNAGHGTKAADHHHHATYAGLQDRRIKALSDQQIEDLMAGRGMSMALPAELNGYPGPVHTLELARELDLSAEQERQTRQLYAEMQHEARALGERLIAAEEVLDRLFRDGDATPENVLAAALEAARAQGELRATHLRYHLHMIDVLTPEQVERYNTVRGYH